MTQQRQKKQQLTTTDRQGGLRVAIGSILLALGFAWALALLVDTAASWNTLRLFRDTAHGLAGVWCPLLPVFALSGGALLCASARYKISWRAYLGALGFYWCLLAASTLMCRMSTQMTLTDYIINNNRTMLGLSNNTAYGAVIHGAYQLRGYNNGQLAGGGMLGMLLAYPLYQTLYVAGGTALLVLAMVALLLVIFRLNPAQLIAALSDNCYRRREQRAQTDEASEQPVPQSAPTQVQQMEMEMPPAVFQTEEETPYLVREAQYQPTAYAQQRYTRAEKGVLEEEYIPVGEEAKPVRHPRSARRQIEETPPAAPAPAAPQEVDDLPPWEEKKEELPAPEVEEIPVEDSIEEQPAPSFPPESPKRTAPVVLAEKSTATRVNGGAHRSGEVHQVLTDPAVPLTGERIPISPKAEEPVQIDPLAVKHTREAMRVASGEYEYPPLRLLREASSQKEDFYAEDQQRASLLEYTLKSFKFDARVESVVHGPSITRFALRLADGVNVNHLKQIVPNLFVAMKSGELRLEVPIPGTSLVGIEVPNAKRTMVALKEVLNSEVMRKNPSPTAVAIGVDINGTPIVCELSDMPHMLIAGATGSGKSVCINTIIQSLLYRATPQQVRMIMIDPKMVELQPYSGIPHLLTDVVIDPKKAAAALDWVVQEMEDRYRRFRQVQARNIAGYNQKMTNQADRMPEIVLIIDEFSDLMIQCRKQVEESIQRLAALARAAGIYMIVATQRPSVNVITGVIKANIPSRIAFAVTNAVDSRTIIDSQGAEKLLGKGDMLYWPRNLSRPARVQGCYVSDEEMQTVVDYVKEHNEALYDERIDEHIERVITQEAEEAAPSKEIDYEMQTGTENELLQKAIEMAVESGQMSISMLRRRLEIGHSRAGKLIDTMAQMGIVSQDEGPKPRRTLITREDYVKMQGQILDE